MSGNEDEKRAIIHVNGNTKYIISTSGRYGSVKRYDILLNDLLNVNIAYLPFHDNGKISPEKFAMALRSLPCCGGAISKDIKNSIIPFLDEIDPIAKRVNSVNTVVVRDGKLMGFNTDYEGFKTAIVSAMHSFKTDIRVAVCYGYGGVVSVAVAVLQELGIDVFLTGRRQEEVVKRANQLGIGVWHAGVDADLFVNAAPVSDEPLENAPNFLESLNGCKTVFDHELSGCYLKNYCIEKEIVHISGLSMYYPQMISQWTLFLEPLGINVENLGDFLVAADQRSKDN